MNGTSVLIFWPWTKVLLVFCRVFLFIFNLFINYFMMVAFGTSGTEKVRIGECKKQ